MSRRTVALAAAALVVGLAAGRMLGTRPGAPANTATRATGHAERAIRPGDANRASAHTADGATAAAITTVRTGQAMLDASDSDAAAAARAMAADETADAQADDLVARLRVLRRTLDGATGPVTYRQAALATKVDAYSDTRATVSVWHVGVLAADGVAPPQANWAVSRFELVWEHGAWKVWSETVTPGPAPIAAADAPPATNASYDAALAGFDPAP
jgi:hypothetical protein